jgi:hypothetical protein
VSKHFLAVPKAGHMVVSLAVGRGRECVVSVQVPVVPKRTASHPLAPSYPGKSKRVREDRDREMRDTGWVQVVGMMGKEP